MHSYEENQKIALIYRIFQAEEWKWISIDKNIEYSPSYGDIEQVITNLEEQAYKEKSHIISSGRITVQYNEETGTYDYSLEL